MSAINAAWELIGDPAARQAFDRDRAAGPRRLTAGRRPDGGRRGVRGRAVHLATGSTSKPAAAGRPPPPEVVSPDWTSGRSSQGGGYDESMRAAEGHGAAGPPPGRPSGTVLNFGRYAGWSLGEVARHDLEYIEWLDRAPIGRNYRQEIDEHPASTSAGDDRPTRRRRTGTGSTAGASAASGAREALAGPYGCARRARGSTSDRSGRRPGRWSSPGRAG